MKRVRDYRYVYENWYKKQCETDGKEPVSLNEYFRMTPQAEVIRLRACLLNGENPKAGKQKKKEMNV